MFLIKLQSDFWSKFILSAYNKQRRVQMFIGIVNNMYRLEI